VKVSLEMTKTVMAVGFQSKRVWGLGDRSSRLFWGKISYCHSREAVHDEEQPQLRSGQGTPGLLREAPLHSLGDFAGIEVQELWLSVRRSVHQEVSHLGPNANDCEGSHSKEGFGGVSHRGRVLQRGMVSSRGKEAVKCTTVFVIIFLFVVLFLLFFCYFFFSGEVLKGIQASWGGEN